MDSQVVAGESEAGQAGRDGRGAARPSRWLKLLRPEAAIFIFFIAVALFMTWPMILRMNTSTYGFASDNQGVMWTWWWFRNAGQFGAKASFSPLVGYPFGTPLNVFLFEPVADLTERFLLLFANEVFVYNLELLASFALSGVTMYYLVRHITGDRRAAFFGGFAYMACVFHAYNSMMFNRLAMTQWMPLFVLTLLWFVEKPSRRNAVWLAVAGLLVGGTSVHYALFMWIFTVTFLIGRFACMRLHGWRARRMDPSGEREPIAFNRQTALLGVGAAVVVIALTVPFYFKVFSNLERTGRWKARSTSGAIRNLETTMGGSAKPYDYVLPNKENFLLGGITTRLVGNRMNSFENSLYLGWVVILLSVFGLVVMLGQGRRELKEARAGPGGVEASPESDGSGDDAVAPAAGHGAPAVEAAAPGQSSPATVGRAGGPRIDPAFGTAGQRALGWGLILSAAVAFILSLPPYIHIGAVKAPMPSLVLRFVAPWLRWYQRFGIVVLLCLVILASMGVASLLSRLKRVPWEAVLVAVLGLCFLETTLVPPFKNFDFSKTPEVYAKIARFEDNAGTVIYPVFEPGFFASQRYLLYQREFKKPMLNGAGENTDGEALRRVVYNPFNPATPGILRRFGIEHVVYLGEMFRKYEGTEPTSEAEVENLPPGLRLTDRVKSIEDFSDAYIFDVTAPAAEFVPIYLGDITVPHIDKGRTTVRLMESKGVIQILNFSGGRARVGLSLPLTNLAFPHEVTLESEGKTLWRGELEGDQTSTAVVPEFTVPAQGADLDILVTGPEFRLDAAKGFVFGTATATIKLGDLAIEPL